MRIADRLFNKWDKNRPSGKSYDDLTDADLDAVGSLQNISSQCDSSRRCGKE